MLAENSSRILKNGNESWCGSNLRSQELQDSFKEVSQDKSFENHCMALSDLAEDVVVRILSFLSPAEIAACCCLSRRFHGLCTDDRKVWMAMCEKRWGAKTDVKKWGNVKISYMVLYQVLDKWDNLVGFWRGVGRGGHGPLVTFDWGHNCLIGTRIIPVRPGSYEVRKVPFLWLGVSSHGKGLCFIDPDWILDSAMGKICGTEGHGINGGSASLAVLDGGLDPRMGGGVGARRIRNPFENWDAVEEEVPDGLLPVKVDFVGKCHIAVEENGDANHNWSRNCQLGRSSSCWDLSKKKSKELLEDGDSYGSLPDRLQAEIYQYFATKVSLGGDRSARKQRRKEKEKASHGRRKWETEHFVKVVNCHPTPARPLQGLWKGISDSTGLEFILVSYNECGGIVCKRVGGYLQNISGYDSVFWTADSTSSAGLNFSSKEEELYNCRTHIRPMNDIKTDINNCTQYDEVEVTRVLFINSDSAGFRHGISVSAVSNKEGRLWQYANGKFGFGFLYSNSIIDFMHIGSSSHLLDVVE
ncbi:F-box protein At3g12350 isoform X2 [Cryptomeria japonica]|uniref:F-box protein At3g12350 isoform X2 n=1 Tax=Cryptomeria japonica TaxID=3369 RepID=UPI0027DA60E2|nr:F-box protein At3g12350 isoform X2 [Cryptomeria japonica]